MANSKALLSISFVLMLINAAIYFSNASRHAVKPCPRDTVKFGACGSWLGLVREVIGTPPSEECCSLVKGLADLEAAVCICSVLKSNVLGVTKVRLPVALNLLLNSCEKNVPQGFVCS